MLKTPKAYTIREHLDSLTREASAIAARLSALTQEIEWLADAVDPHLVPTEYEEAAA